MPVCTLKVSVTLLTGTSGWNQPDAPLVSVPLPTSVMLPGTQTGMSSNGPGPVQLLGLGLPWQ